MKKFALLICGLMMVLGCEEPKQETPEMAAQGFATAFCNYDFKQAQDYCTEAGRRILQFKASNMKQDELDEYQANENSVTTDVLDVTLSQDTLATARVQASNGEEFSLGLVQRDGRWLVTSISY